MPRRVSRRDWMLLDNISFKHLSWRDAAPTTILDFYDTLPRHPLGPDVPHLSAETSEANPLTPTDDHQLTHRATQYEMFNL